MLRLPAPKAVSSVGVKVSSHGTRNSVLVSAQRGRPRKAESPLADVGDVSKDVALIDESLTTLTIEKPKRGRKPKTLEPSAVPSVAVPADADGQHLTRKKSVGKKGTSDAETSEHDGQPTALAEGQKEMEPKKKSTKAEPLLEVTSQRGRREERRSTSKVKGTAATGPTSSDKRMAEMLVRTDRDGSLFVDRAGLNEYKEAWYKVTVSRDAKTVLPFTMHALVKVAWLWTMHLGSHGSHGEWPCYHSMCAWLDNSKLACMV